MNTPPLSRRGLMTTAASTVALAGLGALLPPAARRARASARTSLIVERRTLDVFGKPAAVFGIRQPDGTPGLALDPGETFRIDLDNRAGEDTIIHWHGQTTAHPTAEWVARQMSEAFPWDMVPRYLVRDRDAVYGHLARRRLRALGIRDRPTAPSSPWQNAHVERLIGSIRRECLDHVIVLGESHLRRIVSLYASYYNEVRTHLSLAKDAPLARPIERSGRVIAEPMLGGLHHRYARV